MVMTGSAYRLILVAKSVRLVVPVLFGGRTGTPWAVMAIRNGQ